MPRRLILFSTVLIWLLFLASFLMPALVGADVDDAVNGWHVFSYYMGLLWPVPKYWGQIQQHPFELLISTLPSTNGLMLIAPVVVFRWPRWAAWLGGFLTFGGLVAALGSVEMMERHELLVGFYCWINSIFLMALLCLLAWRGQRGRPRA